MNRITWEQAVDLIRRQPEHRELARNCYFDDPLIEAARRFAGSSEWAATKALLPSRKGCALDLAAGRGIASYALASDGWKVTAIDSDPSVIVGTGAVRALASESSLKIHVSQGYAEDLPFASQSFDMVYARAFLHHAASPARVCSEVARVLRPKGVFLDVREHVISRPRDLRQFLKTHQLHQLYKGENAFSVTRYLEAFRGSGFDVVKIVGPYDSVINYFPMSYNDWWSLCTQPVCRFLGARLTRVLTSQRHGLGVCFMRLLANRASAANEAPGRLFSFLARKGDV